MQQTYPVLSDVRGYGLFIGIELLSSDGKPNTHLAYHIRYSSDFSEKSSIKIIPI